MTEVEIMNNKKTFLELARYAIKRPGIDKLLDWLETTDFFEAPASTKYHEPYRGGLCEHSLVVYQKMSALNMAAPPSAQMSDESVTLCSLFHDACKAAFYKESTRNVKNETTGQWEKVPFYQVEDAFPYGHGEKSVFLLERFIRLTPLEAIAIRWHMGGWDEACRGGSYSCGKAFEMFPAALNLHLADLQATYQKEESTCK